MILLLFIGVVLIVVAGIALWQRRGYSERMNLIRQAVPSSTADIPNAFPGEIVSLTGNLRSEQLLVSEQTETPCIYYDFEIVRRYERNRGGISVGGRGRRRRNRGRQRGKETVAENKQWVPFHIGDDAGDARVNPDGAYFEARQVLNRYEREGSNNLFGIPGLDINIGFGGSRTLGYEIRENVIPIDAPVFIAGPVTENGEIGRHGNSGMVVSYRSESALREDWEKRERRLLIGAAAAAGIGTLLFLGAGVSYLISLF